MQRRASKVEERDVEEVWVRSGGMKEWKLWDF